MNKKTESTIEFLEKQESEYIYTPHHNTPERNRFEDVLSLDHLQSAFGTIVQNKTKGIDVREDQGINKSQIHTHSKLRDILLPKLMSGEVGVRLTQGWGQVYGQR